MPRKKKQPRPLSDRILETAATLFTEKGYDGTTVQQVIDALGISKGAFYHYFSSKEDLLDAVAEKITRDGLALFLPILEDKSVPALERLILYMNRSQQWRMNRMGLIGSVLRVLHRDENAIIRQKINRCTMESIQPILAGLVADGVAEGVFNTPDPSEASTLIVQLGIIFVETIVPLMLDTLADGEAVRLFERRINFYLDTYERLLGIASGTLPRVDRTRIQMILTSMRPPEGAMGGNERER